MLEIQHGLMLRANMRPTWSHVGPPKNRFGAGRGRQDPSRSCKLNCLFNLCIFLSREMPFRDETMLNMCFLHKPILGPLKSCFDLLDWETLKMILSQFISLTDAGKQPLMWNGMQQIKNSTNTNGEHTERGDTWRASARTGPPETKRRAAHMRYI